MQQYTNNHIKIYVHTYIHYNVHTHKLIQTDRHTHVRARTHTHTHARAHTHTHAHAHTHTHRLILLHYFSNLYQSITSFCHLHLHTKYAYIYKFVHNFTGQSIRQTCRNLTFNCSSYGTLHKGVVAFESLHSKTQNNIIYSVYKLCNYIHTHICTYIHTYVRTYVPTYIHTYIHTYTHTYIHTIFIRIEA